MRDTIAADQTIISKLLRTGKVATTVGMLCMMIGGASGALGYRIVGPQAAIVDVKRHQATVDSTINKRIDTMHVDVLKVLEQQDSIVAIMRELQASMELRNYIQCVQLRQAMPELLPSDCAAVSKRRKQ